MPSSGGGMGLNILVTQPENQDKSRWVIEVKVTTVSGKRGGVNSKQERL